MGIFGGSALVLIGYVYWAMAGQLEQQINATIGAEANGLVEVYRRSGLGALKSVVDQRASADGRQAMRYLLADERLRPMAGNLDPWPEGETTSDGWYEFEVHRDEALPTPARGRIVVLAGGQFLLVAQDTGQLVAARQLVDEIVLWALGIGMVLSVIGGMLLSSSVLRRIDTINRTSREIMTGRLQERVPVRGINDEFDQLAQNLNAMLDRIDTLVDGIRAVADNIAHDLRTPLTRLRGQLETFAARPTLDEATRRELGTAIGDADQLLATFSALLRIARLESGGHDREWGTVDMGTLLHDAWELYQAVGEDKGIRVVLGATADEPAPVPGDRDLLFQAIANLLDNAIKYSPAGTEVRLDMTRHDDSLDVIVDDQGPGIPAGEHDKVMQRFYRTAAVTGIPGSGLGLSLVSAIAHHHGGSLQLADNAPGLRVILRLPATAGAQGK